MKIDDLFDLLENNQIENRLDKLIVERIIEAVRDWNCPITDLEEFITLIEKETKNSSTKKDLEKLLKEYDKNGILNSSLNSESIFYLLDIFDYSGFSNIKMIFNDLSIRLNLIEKIIKTENFEGKGFPKIKLFDEYFEIKPRDYSKFKKFEYSQLKELRLVDPSRDWWNLMYYRSLFSLFAMIFSGNDPIYLKIFKINGSDWEYECSNKPNGEFNNIITEINTRIKYYRQ